MPCLWGLLCLNVTCFLHLKVHGLCIDFPVPGVWTFVYRWSVCGSVCLLPCFGDWLLRGLLVLACLGGSCFGLMLFPRFFGEVLSVFSFSGRLLARCIVRCLFGHCPFW